MFIVENKKFKKVRGLIGVFPPLIYSKAECKYCGCVLNTACEVIDLTTRSTIALRPQPPQHKIPGPEPGSDEQESEIVDAEHLIDQHGRGEEKDQRENGDGAEWYIFHTA